MSYYNVKTKTFNCSYKNLTTLPDDIPLECEILHCDCNKITSLEPLRGLVNLKYLYCQNNKITSLEGLSGLVNLQWLSCWGNEITSLEPLCGLVNLRALWCPNNLIRWVSVDLQKNFKLNLNKYRPMFKHLVAKKIQRWWKLSQYLVTK